MVINRHLKLVALILIMGVLPARILASDLKILKRKAIAHARSLSSTNENLNFFASPQQDIPLIKKSTIIKVATAETIPIKIYHIIFSSKDKPYLLDYKNRKIINAFFKKEKLKLSKTKDFLDFINAFLAIANANETLLEKDNFDVQSIQNQFKNIKISTEVKFGAQGKVRLTFFTSGITGSIIMWNLDMNENGLIYKIKRVKITYN